MQIGEISKQTGLSISTLRYYDKHGLLKNIARTQGGIRNFSESDVEAIRLINCLKNTGLTINEIKQFMDWCTKGDETIDTRLSFFYAHEQTIKQQITELENALKLVKFKQWYYETAKKEGSEDHVKNMNYSDYPSSIQELYNDIHKEK